MLSGTSDISYASRQLRRNGLFTIMAVLTLALGIGANTAIFSLLNGIVLRPLPYPEPGRLVQVWPAQTFTKHLFTQYRSSSRTLSVVSAVQAHTFTLTGDAEPEEVAGAAVSPGHFAMLGVEPALGRGFTEEEEAPGRSDVVVLGHGLWQRRYGGAVEIIGRRIEVAGLGGGQRTVVGVMPEGFRPLREGRRVWVPMTIDPSNFPDYRGTAAAHVYGRVADGVTVQAADREVQVLAERFTADQDWITEESRGAAGVTTLHDQLFGPVRTRLLTLLGAVGLVLLIACGNVANLLLARGAARRREMGIRLALGADRLRLVRQLLTESVLLAVIGGIVAAGLVSWVLPTLVAALPADVPRTAGVRVDVPVLAFTLALSALAGVVFGLVPALRSAATELQTTLKEGTGGTRRTRRLNRRLVSAELALTVVLVVAAGLTLKSFWRLQRVDPGLQPDGVVTLRLGPPEKQYASATAVRAYYGAVLERLAAAPGVAAAGAINMLPVTGPNSAMRYGAADRPNPDELPPEYTNVRSVAGDYFAALGIPLVSGRTFRPEDTEGVIVVNEALARTLWPDGEAVDRSVELPTGDRELYRVIGVVGDVHQNALDREPRPEVYFPHASWPARRMHVTVRYDGEAATAIPLLRDAVRAVDDHVPMRARTMDDVIGASFADSRILTALLGAFGALALVLAAVGVYGVTAYAVSQTRFEIGVRMAMGADRRDILEEVLESSLAVVGLGLAAGLLAALAVARLLEAFLFQVRPADPVVLASVVAFLGLVALLASYVPALRATRVDPVEALRQE